MLIEEFNLTIVDSLGNFLSDLMGTASLNHVQAGPAVLRLRARGGTDEQVILQLSLEAILLNVIRHGNWNHSGNFVRNGEELSSIRWVTHLGYPTPVNPDQPM